MTTRQTIFGSLWSALDFETHALEGARPVQVGIARFVGREYDDTFCERVNPEEPITPSAQEIHHISDEMVALSPTFRELAPRINAMIEVSDFIGGYNHGSYDREIAKRCMAEAGFSFDPVIIDPFHWVNWKMRGQKGRKLEDLCRQFGVVLGKAHDAGADAKASGELLIKLVDAGIVPLEVEEAAEMGAVYAQVAEEQRAKWSYYLYVREDQVLRLGYDARYIGMPLADVPKDFLQWAIRKADAKMPAAVVRLFKQALHGNALSFDEMVLPPRTPLKIVPKPSAVTIRGGVEEETNDSSAPLKTMSLPMPTPEMFGLRKIDESHTAPSPVASEESGELPLLSAQNPEEPLPPIPSQQGSIPLPPPVVAIAVNCHACIHRIGSRGRCGVWALDHAGEKKPADFDPTPRSSCKTHHGYGSEPITVDACDYYQPINHIWLSEIAKEAGAASFRAASGHVHLVLAADADEKTQERAERWASAIGEAPGVEADVIQLAPPTTEVARRGPAAVDTSSLSE